ncbi:MAG: T9SS type A sorting domain-containing protein [Chitinophagaceae bacterium]
MQVTVYKIHAQERQTIPKIDTRFFIENKGQWDDEVLFLCRQNGLNSWITKHGVVYDFYKSIKTKNKKNKDEYQKQTHVIRTSMKNASEARPENNEQKLSSFYNFYHSNKRVGNVSLYNEVNITNNYPNINIRYYFDNNSLRYDYIVKPKGKVGNIKFEIEGADEVLIKENKLMIKTSLGLVEHSELFAYQLIDGKKVKVECSFVEKENKVFGFNIGSYDMTKDLIIDPIIYSIIIGANASFSYDVSYGLDATSNGEPIIVGHTSDMNFPTTTGPSFQAGGFDIFVTKYNASGTAIVYSTFLGGTALDQGFAIDVDASGNSYILGKTTSNDFPTTLGVVQPIFGGGTDITVTKLDPLGQLDYSTYVGGFSNDEPGFRIIHNGTKDYITGTTSSPNLPITNSSFLGGFSDVLVAVLDNNATNFDFLTYYGSITNIQPLEVEIGQSLALNSNNDIYVACSVYDNFPTTTGAYDVNYGGNGDAAIVLFQNSGGSVYTPVASTYLGGNASLNDWSTSIVLNSIGDVIVTGGTLSSSFDVLNPLPGFGAYSADWDIFIQKLNPSLTTLLSSTYYGGQDRDVFFSLRLDNADNLHCTGTNTIATSSTGNYPTTPTAYDASHNGTGDVIFTKINAAISQVMYSTYVGGSTDDLGFDLYVVNPREVIITGVTSDDVNITNFPATQVFGNTQTENSFTFRLDICVPLISAVSGNSPTCGNPINLGVSTVYANSVWPVTFSWSGPNGYTSNLQNPVITNPTLANSGTYTITVTDINGCTDQSTVNIIVTNGVQVVAASNCTSSTLNLTATTSLGTPPFTYSWAGPGFTSALQNPSLSPLTTSMNGIYTITVTDASTCSASATILVDVSSCLCPNAPPNAVFHPTGSSSSVDFPGLIALVSTTTPHIFEGMFTVDNNLDISSCPNFYFMPASGMQLAPGKQLRIDNSTLQGCGVEMWTGINIPGNASLAVFRNNTISHMHNGIRITSNANNSLPISIVSNHFNSNTISVFVGTHYNTGNNFICKGNFFESPLPMLPPATLTTPLRGLEILNCGNLTFEDNHFSNLNNGIRIQKSNSLNSDINLDYNTFENINASGGATPNASSSLGWAIYCTNTGTTYMKVRVLGTSFQNPGSTLIDFNNCDKGIHFSRCNGVVRSNKFSSTHIGVNFIGINQPGSSLGDHQLNVSDNIMFETYKGIIKNGNEASNGFLAQNNSITLAPSPNIAFGTNPPIAIQSTYMPSGNIGTSYIYDNTITIPTADQGIGIELNAGSSDHIIGNKIHFTTNTTNIPYTTNVPSRMIGINSNTSTRPNICGNLVDHNSSTDFVPGNNAALKLTLSPDAIINCNVFDRMQMAIATEGHNAGATSSGANNLVTGNTLRGSAFDISHYFLTNEGSLGDIGYFDYITNTGANNNNQFLGSLALSPNFTNNVYRFLPCASNFQDNIYTTPLLLVQGQSTSNSAACATTVTNPPTFTSTFNCTACYYPPTNVINMLQTPNSPMLSIAEAEKIEQDVIIYPEFEEGADRRDREWFFEWMKAKEANQEFTTTTLEAYYTALKSQSIGKINDINKAIDALADSTLLADSVAWHTQFNALRQLNAALATPTIFDQNEKWINGFYFTMMEGIEDSLISEADWQSIKTLAFTCPFIGGQAVYKARVLWSARIPGEHYDDRSICNSQGIYKNAQQEEIDRHNILLSQEVVLLYPNPTTDMVTIESNLFKDADAELEFYDMLGKRVVEQSIPKGNSKHTIVLKNLLHGVYNYKVRINSEVFTGKIVKID